MYKLWGFQNWAVMKDRDAEILPAVGWATALLL